MTTYSVDNDIEYLAFSTLTAANKAADKMKKENPLRTVYISKVTEGINGEFTEVIGEA